MDKPQRVFVLIRMTALFLSLAMFIDQVAFCQTGQRDGLNVAESVASWPAFLGRGATGLSADLVPTQWSSEKNIAWKTKLTGAGQSSPVVWGDRVFVTSIEGAMKETCVVSAVSLIDGRVLWTHQMPATQQDRSNYYQSRAAPTPVVDADGVYAFFETGNVIALSHDGEVLWTRSLVDDFGEFENRIGLAASLVQTKANVVVLVDHEGPSYLLAINKSTGIDAWKTERFSRQSYSSPIVLPIGQSMQIVVSSSGSVDGYDPQTGQQLWTYKEVGGNRSTTPLPVSGNRFLVGASPGMHDQYVTDARKSNLVIEIESDGGTYTPKVIWRTNKAMPSFASPMVHQGLAYWITKIGIVFCFDAQTGEKVYSQRLGGSCWATPLGVGERVYFFGKDGTTTVAQAGRTFKVLHKNELITSVPQSSKTSTRPLSDDGQHKQDTNDDASKTDNDPPRRGRDGLLFAENVQYGYAVVGGSIVIRTGSQLFCIRDENVATKAEVIQEPDDQ